MSGSFRFALASVAIALGFAISAAPASAQDDTPPPKIDGQAALDAIVGSTIIGNGAYGVVVMYIGSDHVLDSLKKTLRTKGRWSYQDGKFCIEHENHCAKITVFGTRGVFDYDGNIFPFNIESGNQVDAYASRG